MGILIGVCAMSIYSRDLGWVGITISHGIDSITTRRMFAREIGGYGARSIYDVDDSQTPPTFDEIIKVFNGLEEGEAIALLASDLARLDGGLQGYLLFTPEAWAEIVVDGLNRPKVVKVVEIDRVRDRIFR